MRLILILCLIASFRIYSEEAVKKEPKYNIATGYKFMKFGSGYDERIFNGGFTNFTFAFKNDSEFYFGVYSIVSSLKNDTYESFPYTKSDFYAITNFGSSFGIQKKKKYDAPAYFYAGMNFKFKPDSPSLERYIGISLGRFPGETYEELQASPSSLGVWSILFARDSTLHNYERKTSRSYAPLLIFELKLGFRYLLFKNLSIGSEWGYLLTSPNKNLYNDLYFDVNGQGSNLLELIILNDYLSYKKNNSPGSGVTMNLFLNYSF